MSCYFEVKALVNFYDNDDFVHNAIVSFFWQKWYLDFKLIVSKDFIEVLKKRKQILRDYCGDHVKQDFYVRFKNK